MKKVGLICLVILCISCTPKREDIFRAISEGNIESVKKIVELYPDLLSTSVDIILSTEPTSINIDNAKDDLIKYGYNSSKVNKVVDQYFNGALDSFNEPRDFYTILFFATEQNYPDKDIVEFLLNETQKRSNLEEAIYASFINLLNNNKYELSDIYLKNSTINLKETIPIVTKILDIIITNDNLESLKYLIDNGISLNEGEERWPVWKAVRYGSDDLLKYLIDSGANINIQNYSGDVPLSWTVAYNMTDKSKTLLESNADPNIPNNNGFFPVHESSSAEVIELLVSNGADINVISPQGYNALLLMVRKIRLEDTESAYFEQLSNAINKAIELGIDINMRDTDGNTPLKYLVDNNAPDEAIEILRKHNAIY